MNGIELADLLSKQGIKIKSKTNTSIVVLVIGDRIAEMRKISGLLEHLGATIDSSLKGSSIGGIKVGRVKILVKADGKSGGLDVESVAIDDLNNAILAGMMYVGGPIKIKLKNKTVSGVSQVLKTAGTPKSDFHLADQNDKPLVHISHKKGSTPRDFQQWGGVTEKEILAHPEVQKFAEDCRKEFGTKIPNGESVYRKIQDKNLKMMSVFGVKFNSGYVDPQKVDVLLQGDPGIKHISNDVFELTATGHVNYHGDVPDGGFEPVLAMIYKGDRDQFGIKGARASIYPLQGRSFKRQI